MSENCHAQDRDDEGEGLKELAVDVVPQTLNRKPGGKRCCEDRTPCDCSSQGPAAKDHCGDSNESSAPDHRVLKQPDLAKDEEPATKTRSEPCEIHRLPATLVDVDTRDIS